MWRCAPIALVLALIFGIVATPDRVKGQIAQTGSGCSVGLPPCGGAVGFQGIGDILSGALAMWGTQAYTAATRGNKVVNACQNVANSYVGCVDLSTDATTGKLVPGLVNGLACNVITCIVHTFYDQSGTNNCGGIACDLTPNAIGNAPALTLSVLGGTACVSFTSASSQALQNVTGFTQAQIYSLSAVAERTGNTSAYNGIFADTSAASQLGFDQTSGNVMIYAGGAFVPTAPATESVFHAMQFVVNAASSSFYVDGANTPASSNPGSTGIASTIFMGTNGTSTLQGYICESAVYGSDITSSRAAINANQHSGGRWNF